MSKNILDKIGVQSFLPPPYLHLGKIQTIAASYWPHNVRLSSEQQHRIQLSDGDQLVLIENRPPAWSPSQRIILLVHGLTGSSSSSYMVRVSSHFLQEGYTVMRLNLRGCGPGKGLARFPYHAGRSDDTRTALLWLAEHFPYAPVTQIGFSLGGNITLKMVGEENPAGNLDSVVAVSAPLDLETSVKNIMKRSNKLFHDFFMKELIKHVRANGENLAFIENLYHFDDVYTALHSGFKDAQDYYKRSSSGQFLNQIKVKTFILSANDDPFISSDILLNNFSNPNIDVVITERGGHVGWLACPFRLKYFYWMDKTLVTWVNWFEKNKIIA